MRGSIACFSLGSNMGDRVRSLEEACNLIIKRSGNPGSVSGMYESPSWGYESNRLFVNCCLSLYTAHSPLALMDLVLGIEKEMGRIRQGIGYADRVIDVDMLLYDDRVIDHPRLTIPHPRMHLRRFVLVPLADIVPDMIHPGTGLTISDMLVQCSDKSIVTPL